MDKDLQAVKISVRVDRIDGTYSQLENWFVPNVTAEELLCALVDHQNRWYGSIEEIDQYLKSKREAIDFFKSKENPKTI